MPLYEYICGPCGVTVTERRLVDDRHLRPCCPECGGGMGKRPASLTRVWSPTRKGDK